MSRQTQDEELIKDKLKTKEHRVLQLEKDKHNLQAQLKEKDDIIQTLKNKQKQKENIRD